MANEKKQPEGKVLKRVGPAVRMIANGEPAWYLDFRYTDAHGNRKRFRQKAEVQTQTGAVAEGEARKAKALRTGNPTGPLDVDGSASAPESAPRERTWAERTLEEVLPIYWDTWAHAKLAKSTRDSYRKRFRVYIVPKFGNTPIGKIDRAAVAEFDGELAREGVKSPTRRIVHIALRSLLCRCAVELKWCEDPPRMPKMPKGSDTKPDVMNDEQVNAVLAVAEGPEELAFLLSTDAGLRPGEVRELRRSDIQKQRYRGRDRKVREQVFLHVRRGYVSGEVKGTKTGEGRLVPVTPRLAAKLPPGGGDALVTTNANGERWAESALGDSFRRAIRKAGLEAKWTHYDLRHYFCTTLFRARVNPRVIMSLMGHADLETTLRYAHLVQEDLFHAVNDMADFQTEEAKLRASDGELPDSGVLAHRWPMDPEAA